jgi:hypothetical protein
MKRRFFLTHTVRQTYILASLDSWVTNTPSVKMLCPQNMACPYTVLSEIRFALRLRCVDLVHACIDARGYHFQQLL